MSVAAIDVRAAPEVEVRAPAWGAVCAMALCSFVLVASEFMPVSLLSPIAHELHLTEGQAGQAISVSVLFAVLTSLSVARLIGTIDRRHVLLAITLGAAVGGVVYDDAGPIIEFLGSGVILLIGALTGFIAGHQLAGDPA